MPYWLPFFSRSSRCDVEIVMEMVALIQEYPTYKNTFYLTVISPLMFVFWPNKRLEVPWPHLKRGVSPTPRLEKKRHKLVSSVNYQMWQDVGDHPWELKTAWKMQLNITTRKSQGQDQISSGTWQPELQQEHYVGSQGSKETLKTNSRANPLKVSNSMSQGKTLGKWQQLDREQD